MQIVVQHPKILTISIAAYNSEKYIAKCLDSLTSCKTLDKLEVFVINDGSMDSTQMIAEQYQKKYPDSIIVVNKENGGHGSTINYSIKQASGRYFKLVDADDWVESEGLDKLVGFLENTTVDLVLNPYTHVNPEGETIKTTPSVKSTNIIEYGKEYDLNKISDVINYYIHTSTLRTEIVKQIGKPITEHCYYVDNEYILYSVPHVHTVVALDYAIYRYLYGTPEQSVNPENWIRRRNERLQVTHNLIQFYNSYDKDNNGYNLIHNVVLNMIRGQYVIYFMMTENQAGKKEMIQFDNYLKEECHDLYSDLVTQGRRRSVLFFKILRKTNFHGYGLLRAIIYVSRFGRLA